jgi:hypothetical protein
LRLGESKIKKEVKFIVGKKMKEKKDKEIGDHFGPEEGNQKPNGSGHPK